ncbi:MAG: OmpA family protein [Nitrospiraceae bacterium]|nr:OmpA family protein [Nitrospiraceae bacterium]
MSRGTILGIGILALTLLAFLCIPRHLPVAPAAAVPASFSAVIDNGQLTLSGVLAGEQEKATALARSQELFKGGKLRITDNLEVTEGTKPGGWETALPLLLAQLHALHPTRASITLEGHTLTVKGSVSSAEAKARLLRDTAAAVGSVAKVQDQITISTSAAVPAPSSPAAATGTAATSAAAAPAPTMGRAQIQAAVDEAIRGESVAFESNSATLTSRGRAVVDRIGNALKRAPDSLIEIAGHTDPYGDPEYNLELSRKRADAVRQYLVDHGSTNRFSVVGYGSTRPLINERTRAASQKNRRIEFRVKEER